MPWKSLPQAVVWACLAMPFAARAHDLWLEPKGDALVLRCGHRGGEVLDLDASKVEGVRCKRGEAPARDVRASSVAAPRELRTPSGCDIASAFLDGGFWSLTPDGEKNLPKDEVPDAAGECRGRVWASDVESVSATLERPLGTPQADPLTAEASLTFQVAR